MIRIEIHPDAPVATIPTKRGQMRKQEAFAHTLSRDGKPAKYPTRCELVLPDDGQAFAPGTYSLAPQSVYVDRYGNLALSPKLVAVATR